MKCVKFYHDEIWRKLEKYMVRELFSKEQYEKDISPRHYMKIFI